MKVVIYSHFFAPSIGGVETVVLSLAHGISELPDREGRPPFDVVVVTQTPADRFDDRLLPFQVVRQPSLAQLWHLIRSAEVVHVAGPALGPMLIALLLRKPLILEHHGFQAICPNGQLLMELSNSPCPGHFMAGNYSVCLRCNSKQGWLASFKLWSLTFIRRFLCTRVSANVIPTVWLGNQLRVPSLVHIAHGVECNGASPRAARWDVPVIAFQGRIVSTKGAQVLLQAARTLQGQKQPVHLLIIGEGPERSALESFSRDAGLGDCVEFVGRVPDSELDAKLAQATMIVVPSLAGEVFGLVVVENMLRGIAVIASNIGAFAEVLGEGGLTFQTGDPVDLARQITTVLKNPELRVRLEKSARERVLALYNRSRMVESHAELYMNIGPRTFAKNAAADHNK